MSSYRAVVESSSSGRDQRLILRNEGGSLWVVADHSCWRGETSRNKGRVYGTKDEYVGLIWDMYYLKDIYKSVEGYIHLKRDMKDQRKDINKEMFRSRRNIETQGSCCACQELPVRGCYACLCLPVRGCYACQ